MYTSIQSINLSLLNIERIKKSKQLIWKFGKQIKDVTINMLYFRLLVKYLLNNEGKNLGKMYVPLGSFVLLTMFSI